MDLGKSFTYVFEDDNWVGPILLGGLILLIPIIGQFWLLGYVIACARRELGGSSDLLPSLDGFGEKLADGFKVFIISLVYYLPAIVVAVIASLLFIIPTSITGGGGDSGDFIATMSIIFFTICFIPLMIILGILLQVLSFGAMAVYVSTDKVSEALRFGEVYKHVSRQLGPVAMLWLVQILAGFVGSLGSILFGFGALFTTVYASAMFGNYLGQFARKIGLPALVE